MRRAQPTAAERRVAEITAVAERVWRDSEEALRFLDRPHPLLAGARPRDVAVASNDGANQVICILGRLVHGTAA
jgi:putative toxin-antitoxin system antitoxin component (TIGR02293 family)